MKQTEREALGENFSASFNDSGHGPEMNEPMRTAIRRLYDDSYKPRDTTEAANETALTHSGDFDDYLQGMRMNIRNTPRVTEIKGRPPMSALGGPNKTPLQCDSLPMATLQYQR
jgi:hypothetical protein